MNDVEACIRLDPDRLVESLDRAVLGGTYELLAPAKLNLRLKVLGRRADGYHLLSMLNVSSTLEDILSITLTREKCCTLSMTGAEMEEIKTSDNSVTRCFDEFWREFGLDEAPLGFTASLTKRIPIGAGLGGGSSDAGAMLRFLEQHFSKLLCEALQLSAEQFSKRIMRVAMKVGADVPYAYRGGVCWVTGVGEVVQQLAVSRIWPGEVLISVPPVPVATVAFYNFFREQHPVVAETRDHLMEALVCAEKIQLTAEILENDFERDVCTFVPAVDKALRCAREFFPVTTALTGSGSAIFSLVDSPTSPRVGEYLRAAALEGLRVHRVRVYNGEPSRSASHSNPAGSADF